VEKLEKNVNLLNWQNSIEYQMWDGVEYSELDDVSKIVCLTRDFYNITKGKWNTSDLLLLKTAMSTVGISPKAEISYRRFILEVSQDARRMKKLFENMDLDGMERYPAYIAITAGIRKGVLFGTDEQYLVDNTLELLRSHSCDASETEIKKELLEIYERDNAQVDLKTPVYAYDLILEMLYNLEQIKEIQYVRTLDEKLKEAEMLFSVYDTEKLIPLLKELMQYEITKAKYMMALLYETGCAGLKRDDDKCIQLLEECIFEGYLPAKVRKLFPINSYYWNNKEKEKEIHVIFTELEKQADDGDMFAAEGCARTYDNFSTGKKESLDMIYEKRDYYYKKAPLVSYYHALGWIYSLSGASGYDEEYIVALSYHLKAADMGYNPSEYMVGEHYRCGHGIAKNPELSFQYYTRAYEHGNWEAIVYCGWCYLKGFGTEKDEDLAYKFFSEGTNLGLPECISHLGWCYQYGYGVEDDVEKAKELYQKAAEKGDEWAQKCLEDGIF
jgi:hypothetical protein